MSTELSIDFETASTVDLRRSGAVLYAASPDTRVLCMAYVFDDDPAVSVWRIGEPFPPAVLYHVRHGRRVNAWNASFEYHLWNGTLLRQLGLTPNIYRLALPQLHDTMAAAAYWGLPLSLDQAAPAAGLTVRKDKDGHALMLRMCRPRGENPLTGEPTWWHEDDPAKFQRLCEYCADDVQVERAVRHAIPDLPKKEREVWLMDQRVNNRGVPVDYKLVEKLKTVALAAADRAADDLAGITGGAVRSVNSTAAMLAFVKTHGYPHDDLRKSTVAERLDDPECDGLERAVLEIRADAAKTSAAKLDAMLSASDARGGIGRVYGMLQYYGASRTGRWSGRLIQLQNMPRGTIKDTDLAITAILNGAELDGLEMFFGPPLGVVSSCLRGCIAAPQGKALVVADFSQIEARVLPWLAGAQMVLAVFRSGGDIYVQAAAGIFGRVFPAGHKFVKADVPPEERDIGKVAVLALGFGGGKGAFATMARAYGMTVDDVRAEEIKTAWRDANPEIVRFWWALDAAARAILSGASQIEHVGPLRLGMWGRHLVIALPSGRALVYREAKLTLSPDRPGTDEITYMGVNQYTRKWERIRTYGGKLTENVVQAVARDVMAGAMLRADQAGMDVILTVHDEIVVQAPAATAPAVLDGLLGAMRTPPAWAPDLPTDAAGWHGPRYRK